MFLLLTVTCASLSLARSSPTGPSYKLPQIYLQAAHPTGLAAFLPDSCDLENFTFRHRLKNSTRWNEGTGKREDGFWIYLDEGMSLREQDIVEYMGSVQHRGLVYTQPQAEWVVTGLVSKFEPPPKVPESDEICDENKTKHTEKNEKKESPVTDKPNDEKSVTEKSLEKRTSSEETDNEGKPSKVKEEPSPSLPSSPDNCPWAGKDGPPMSREDQLERQLSMLQCELASFLTTTTRLTTDLNRELLDLKKLNYATVGRIQQLETLLRALPRVVPYSSY